MARFYTGGMVWVTVYEVGRAYGGPEEGGWWYDCGDPATDGGKDVSVYVPRRIANKVVGKLEVKYPRTGRASSVNGGEDWEVFIQDHPPESYPLCRPRWDW